MQDFLNSVTEFFTGRSSAPPNPDRAFNVLLLKETKHKIETGLLTRYLQRPLVYILETLAYVITIALFFTAIFYWNKVDNLFDAIDTINFMNKVVNGANLIEEDYDWVSYCILAVFLLPSFIGFLLARLFTASRKKTTVFIEVENMIDRVVYNLEDKK